MPMKSMPMKYAGEVDAGEVDDDFGDVGACDFGAGRGDEAVARGESATSGNGAPGLGGAAAGFSPFAAGLTGNFVAESSAMCTADSARCDHCATIDWASPRAADSSARTSAVALWAGSTWVDTHQMPTRSAKTAAATAGTDRCLRFGEATRNSDPSAGKFAAASLISNGANNSATLAARWSGRKESPDRSDRHCWPVSASGRAGFKRMVRAWIALYSPKGCLLVKRT